MSNRLFNYISLSSGEEDKDKVMENIKDKYAFNSIYLTGELKTLFPETKGISIGIQQLNPGTDYALWIRIRL